MRSFVKEFKAFAMKGNVIDLAVAVIIGVAFGKIVSSLVDDIIMPFVGVLLGGIDFSSLYVNVGDSAITYGVFIQSVVDFIIVAVVIFLVIRSINKLNSPETIKENKPTEPSEEVKLLREIRDELKR